MTAWQYCTEIARAADRLRAITGKAPLPLFRAPGGKTSAQLRASAKACGYTHVGWSPAGFLGDELPSERELTDKFLGLIEGTPYAERGYDLVRLVTGLDTRPDTGRFLAL